jgi:branched-subunit amino acid aminotransferase/4-amino-4-deoxychorismate lyase
VPVRSLDGELIGKGEPGPVTRRLTAAFTLLANSTGTPIDL